MNTSKLYDVEIKEFKNILETRLQGKSTSTDVLFTILQTELDLLNKHLDKLRETRDSNPHWMEATMPMYIAVERKRDTKREKLQRYKKELLLC